MNNNLNNNNVTNFNTPKQPVNNTTQFQTFQQPIYNQQPIKNKKHGKTILLIVIAIALVIALVFGIKFIMSHNKTVDKNIESTFDSNALIPVKKDGKYGYIDLNGKFVIQPQYDYATPFYGDYAKVTLDPKAAIGTDEIYQLIDKFGNVKATANYTENIKHIGEYTDYNVWILNKQLYNSSLEKLSPENTEVRYVEDGYFAWTNKNNKTGGIMNSSGKITYTYKFEDDEENYIFFRSHFKNSSFFNTHLKEHYCVIGVENKKYAIVNCDTGKVIYDYTDKSITNHGDNIFELKENDTHEFVSKLYIQNDKIVFQTYSKNVNIKTDNNYKYFTIVDYDKESDQRYSYIDLSLGQTVDQKPTSSPNLVTDEWEEYTSITKFSCDVGYGIMRFGLMSGEKEKIPCEWSRINYLDLPLYKYLSSKGKEYVITRRDDKVYLLNLKDGKSAVELNTIDVNNVRGSSFVYYTDNDTKNKVVYNVITDKSLPIESGADLTIYSNYITLKKDGKLNYYNADLKLIYTE